MFRDEKFIKPFDCQLCSDEHKRVRLCSFVSMQDRSDKRGFVIPTSIGNHSLLECPKGFALKNCEYQIFFDFHFALEKHIPLIPNAGILDYPNVIIEMLKILYQEKQFYEEKQLQRASEKHN